MVAALVAMSSIGCDGGGVDDDGGAGSSNDGSGGGAPVDTSPARTRPGATIVHLFEWKWADVARECETYLGPKGFDAVQISPATEHAVFAGSKYPWWQRYQPVSYGLTSRSGDAAAFDDMVSRCAAVGVDIYVDAVINHMSSQPSGTGSGGSTYTKYEYAGLYTRADFHDPACVIDGADYTTNAERVRTCELLGLSDLRTEADEVQDKIVAMLVDFVNRGVRGFRIDAAKHMGPSDIRAIIEKVGAAVGAEKAPYFFLEVIDNGGEAIAATEYLDAAGTSGSIVDVTEFKYAGVGEKFRGFFPDEIGDLAEFDEESWSLLPSDRAVSFITNHDTQRGGALTYADGARAELANVFLLAHPYGVPQLLSGFAFDRATSAGNASGPPSDDGGHTNSIFAEGSNVPSCAAAPSAALPGEWVCEHRHPSVAAMVEFRSVTHGKAVTNAWSNEGAQLAFGREGTGFVAFNLEETALEATLSTDLPAGIYCDVLSGDDCAQTLEVKADGSIDLRVEPMTARAIHTGAKMP